MALSNAWIKNNGYANMTAAQTHVTAQEVNQELLPGHPHSAITTLSPIPLLTNTLLPPTTTDERHERVVEKSAISKEL